MYAPTHYDTWRRRQMDKAFVVLLETGFDWPEVVFVGTYEECNRYVNGELSNVLEEYGPDDEVYYETVTIVDAKSALQHRTDELFDGEPPERVS